MAVLPTPELIIEDEVHLLRDCKKYEDLRVERSPEFNLMLNNNVKALFDQDNIAESSNFIYKLFKRRFE